MSGGSNSTTKNRIKDHYPYSEPHMIKAQYNCFIEFPAISSVVDEAKAGPPGEFILKMRLYKSEEKFDDEFVLIGNITNKVQYLLKQMTDELGIPIYKGLHRKGIEVEFKDHNGKKLQQTRTFAYYKIVSGTTVHLRPAAFGKPETLSTKCASEAQAESHHRQRNEYTAPTISSKRVKGRKSHIPNLDSEDDGDDVADGAGYCRSSCAAVASFEIDDDKSALPSSRLKAGGDYGTTLSSSSSSSSSQTRGATCLIVGDIEEQVESLQHKKQRK